MKIFKHTLIIGLLLSSLFSCSDFMDIVPDNVAEIDQAFAMRSTAERFLFTCYSYMPSHVNEIENPAFYAGGEMWVSPSFGAAPVQIARGNQRVVDPYSNYWEGRNGGKDLYEGIRQTNIFLENIGTVPDMEESERNRWIAEAKFLKAYYHFWLTRMYGPIVIVKENLPISDERDRVDKPRAPVDSSFAYIEQLLDEAIADLPDHVENEISELGRITKAIALSVKAKVLVTAASPLFNGNESYIGFTGPEGEELFNTSFEIEKWQKAAEAAKEAIDLVESLGYELYQFEPQFSQYDLSDTTLTKMSIRNSVTEKWNTEIIWGNTNSIANNIQALSIPRGLDPEYRDNTSLKGSLSPPIDVVEMFYSDNGVPITEDKTWDYSNRFNLQIPTEAERFNLKEGYTTAALNFDREPRFYASMGFDGSTWYGQGRLDDTDQFFVSSKNGDPAARWNPKFYSSTGYWTKKLVNYNNVIESSDNYAIENYPWPVIRLADLYLLYAEALNEAEGPIPEVHQYIDIVRERAGLPPVEEAWTNYSTNPSKFSTKEGMREIIQQERMIELAFEGKRFWDLRRWKRADVELNKSITGWDLDQETPEGYYRERFIYDQRFTSRDYLWPLSEDVILSNTKSVQNPGW